MSQVKKQVRSNEGRCDYKGVAGGILVRMKCSVSGLYQGRLSGCILCYSFASIATGTKEVKAYMRSLSVLSYSYSPLKIQTLFF